MQGLTMWVTGPEGADVDQVAGLLERVPGMGAASNLNPERLHHTVMRLLRSRDGLPRNASGALPGWVHRSVAHYLAIVPRLLGPPRSVVRAAACCGNGALLQGVAPSVVGLVVADDPRRRFRPASGDLIEQAAVHGQAWAHTLEPARAVAEAVPHWRLVVLTQPNAGPLLAAFLQGLGMATRGLPISPRPPLAWDPLMEAALRAHPAVDRMLRALGLRCPPVAPPTAHPSLARVHTRLALEQGDVDRAQTLLDACPDGVETAVLRARASRLSGDEGAAAEVLSHVWTDRASVDAVRLEALLLGDVPIAVQAAASVGPTDPEPIRTALAHWLVRMGMDPEAAELVARVEGTGWRSGIRVVG